MTDAYVFLLVFQGWPYEGRDQKKRFLYEVTLGRFNDTFCSLLLGTIVFCSGGGGEGRI